MLKTTLSYITSLLLLFSLIGINIEQHLCGGEVTQTLVYGMEIGEPMADADEHCTHMADCGHCQHKQLIKQASYDFTLAQAPTTVHPPLLPLWAPVFALPAISFSHTPEALASAVYFYDTSPPPRVFISSGGLRAPPSFS